MKAFSRIVTLFGLFAMVAMPTAQAQPDRFVEGTHYDELARPVRTASPDKIEVTEVFWYGCNHCYSFEPLIENWEENIADDVEFVRSPGMWNELMEVHARIFYTAQTLEVLDDIHPMAFNEIHQRGNYLQTEDAIADLFVEAEVGVSREEFESAWNSFSVNSSVSRANTRMRDYGVRSVPSLIVNGKYRITAGGANRSQADMLRVADFLVEQERSEG